MSNPLEELGDSLVTMFKSLHETNEVQYALLVEIGKGLGAALLKLGLVDEAASLGIKYEMAAQALRDSRRRSS